MIRWLTRRAKRKACEQLVNELFTYNRKDACFDPIGPVDRFGMLAAIESIVVDTLKKTAVENTEVLFRGFR